MMEDSYETSIIDFLADEITDSIISNPDNIRNMIKDKIRRYQTIVNLLK
jgi:predicted DNA-binding transcriptional regulator YafY